MAKSKRNQRDNGSASIATMLAVAMILVVALMLTNVIIMQLGKGIVTAALTDGARTGARTPPATAIEACQQAIEIALEPVRDGLARNATITCDNTNDMTTAKADIRIEGWFTSITDYTGTLQVSVARVDG